MMGGLRGFRGVYVGPGVDIDIGLVMGDICGVEESPYQEWFIGVVVPDATTGGK